MSKFGRFAAACAAVVCSFGAFAAGTADENGVVPDYWYTFDGAIVKKGANGLSTIDKLTPEDSHFVATDETSGHKAYS